MKNLFKHMVEHSVILNQEALLELPSFYRVGSYFAGQLSKNGKYRNKFFSSNKEIGKYLNLTEGNVSREIKKLSHLFIREGNHGDRARKWVLVKQTAVSESIAVVKKETPEIKIPKIQSSNFSEIKKEIQELINRNDIFEGDEYFHLMIEKLGYASGRPDGIRKQQGEANSVKNISCFNNCIINYLELYADMLSSKTYKLSDSYFSTFCDFCKIESNQNKVSEILQNREIAFKKQLRINKISFFRNALTNNSKTDAIEIYCEKYGEKNPEYNNKQTQAINKTKTNLLDYLESYITDKNLGEWAFDGIFSITSIKGYNKEKQQKVA